MKNEANRAWDRALNIQTIGREDWQGAKYMPYEPTPYTVLVRLADSGLVSPRDHVLDYGCGKGRVAFFLASRIGCRVTGIDRSDKLIALANENRAAFAHPERITFLTESAERYRPKDENVFFFFNPFSEAVLEIVLRQILYGREQAMRSRLIFYYPSDLFLSRLSFEPMLKLHDEIDCRDLFDGDNPRERIVVYDSDNQCETEY